MRSVDLKSSTNIDFDKEYNNQYSRIKFCDYVRISKYKNIFGKDCLTNWS